MTTDITALGNGKFAVVENNEHYTVKIERDQSLRCTCKEATRYLIRCAHQAAVLTYVTKFHHLPEKEDMPDLLDVAQLNQEDINVYIVKLNRAYNVLTAHREKTYNELQEAIEEWIASKNLRKQVKLQKLGVDVEVEAMKREEEKEILKGRIKTKMDILSLKMEEVRSARMSAMSILKTLRP